MSFPLYYILFPAALFLAVWFFLSLVGFYHLARFGFRHIGLLLIVLVYIGGSALILQTAYAYLAPVDWQASVIMFSRLPAALPAFGTSY